MSTATKSILISAAAAAASLGAAIEGVDGAIEGVDGAFAALPHRSCAAKPTTALNRRAGPPPLPPSHRSLHLPFPGRCYNHMMLKASSRRKDRRDAPSPDNRDAKDLEEARDASSLLDYITSSLGWFGGGGDEGVIERTERTPKSSSPNDGVATKQRGDRGVGDGDAEGFSFTFPWFSLLDPQSEEAKRQSLAEDIKTKYSPVSPSPRDLSRDGFGVLLPVAEKVDELTGGWGLSYADLAPETPKTPIGRAFLATNAFYALAGLALSFRGDLVLGTMTEVAGIVSFWYHYSQLEFGQDRSEVRLALLTDYFTAGTALITGGFYMAMMGVDSVPVDVLLWGVLGVLCLTCSWVWEFGYPYLFWHSLWHLFSAYAGYLIG